MRNFLLFIVTSLGLLLYSCNKNPQKGSAFPPTQVSVLEVNLATIPQDFEYVGFAKSSHMVEIRSRVEGYLEKIAYQEGRLVEKDQLLFQLDSMPFEAALDMEKGNLAHAEAILWEAKRTADRLKPLFEQNAASRRDLDTAISRQLSAEADVQSSKAKVKQAELNLGYTTIKSPIRGLAGQSNYRVGALITPGEKGLLTTISIIDPIWVTFSVSESDVLKFRNEVAQKTLIIPENESFEIELILTNGQVYPQRGKVDFTEPYLQQATGTLNIRAVFDNPLSTLIPGQFVKVRVLGAVRPDAVVIPQRAVLQGKSSMYVYVVEEGKAIRRAVEPGDWYGDDWIISSGLKKGDKVIVDGVNKVQDGFPVSIKDIREGS